MVLTKLLVAAALGGLMPLALLLYKLASQGDKAEREVLAGNPWAWVWNAAVQPALAVAYAYAHSSLGSLDVAAAFELGVGVPIAISQIFDRLPSINTGGPGQ